jgi:hypothetical protein
VQFCGAASGGTKPPVTHGAVEAMGPTHTGVPISMVFQGKGSSSCNRGEHGALSCCVCQEVGLTTN